MSRSFLKQDTQINSSFIYDGTIAPGATLENTGSTLEQDLNALRSQVKRLLASGSGAWYDDLAVVVGLDGSKQRGLSEIAFNLDDLESKRVLCPVQVLTDVIVSASSDVVFLDTNLNYPPTVTIASGTGLGTVVAELPSGSLIGTASLALLSGSNPLLPKNLVQIRSAVTKDAIGLSGSQIWGLLQVAYGGLVQGTAFNNTTRAAQISFVYVPSGTDQLAFAPTGTIGGQILEYMYSQRVSLETLPEDCNFPDARFVDNAAQIGATVDLNTAIDNQVGPATQDQDIDVDISNSFAWAFRSGSTDLIRFQNNTSGGEIEINASVFDVNATTNDFAEGATFDSTGNAITVGVTAGLIQAASNLTVASNGNADLIVSGNRELFFDDGNQQGSTWAQTSGIKLSDMTEEWNTFETLFGEVSLLSAIISGSNAGGHFKGYVVATANIPANTNAAIGTNLSGSFPSYTTESFLNDVNVFVNGQLLRNGEDANANYDVYPGVNPAAGDLRFEFALKGTGPQPDVVTLEVFR